MTDLMARPLVPIASKEDAKDTYEAIAEYLDADANPVLIYVVEKAGGGIDKAGVEQREEAVTEAFNLFQRLAADDGVAVETAIHYDTDVVEGIRAAAREHDATSIAFQPRGGSRITEFLSGNVRSKLTKGGPFPVVVLPDE
ncbi:hypothetical protein JCM17823_26520 [Halorubrum gandharaense]